VPLNETFVPLQVVSDEPLYDTPGEQQRQFEAMRQRTDLSIEERDAYLQRLHIIWQSQLRWNGDGEQAQQPLLIDELLSQLSSNNPVAMLLGTPGSGKSIFLRWLALTMTRATLTPGTYPIPNGFGREQVPILVRTGEYAERLDKEDLSLKQFLILQWNKINPNLASKLLDELSQGRCLVLLDRLDLGASVSVHRHLLEAIREFIADYSSSDPNNYNRFIITTRIADSEPGDFARYTHFTMLDLDQQRMEQMLATWCSAIAHSYTNW
jgi:predicted NACHT family NTPase